MGKSSRSRGSSVIGKGEVTQMQVAFIVDRYLSDNGFSETRIRFRSEASSLISNSPLRNVTNNLMTLDDMLNDYVSLKQQKVTMDQERVRLDQEKIRVQNLLQGMQNVMNTYNASFTPPPHLPPGTAHNSQLRIQNASSSGLNQCSTPNAMTVSLLGNKRVDFGNFSTPSTTQSVTRKRKGLEVSTVAPPVSRKARISTAQENSMANGINKITQADKAASNFSSQTPSETPTLAKKSATNELIGHGSRVVKCLFNKADPSIPSSSTCLGTPQNHASPGNDKSNNPQKEVTPTNCTLVTKEKFTISPCKQIASYTMERSHLISSSPVKSNLKMSNKRDHVKGRLNFDDTDTLKCLEPPATADLVSTSPSGSEPEDGLFDMDFPNLDFLSENCSLSELLLDFDLGYEGSTNHCLSQTPNATIETVSGSSPESGVGNLELDQVCLETTSAVTERSQEMMPTPLQSP